MEEILKKIDIKKVGNISMIITTAVVTYYVLSIYKTNLEIKTLKKNLNE
jgi:hypothetical protein